MKSWIIKQWNLFLKWLDKVKEDLKIDLGKLEIKFKMKFDTDGNEIPENAADAVQTNQSTDSQTTQQDNSDAIKTESSGLPASTTGDTVTNQEEQSTNTNKEKLKNDYVEIGEEMKQQEKPPIVDIMNKFLSDIQQEKAFLLKLLEVAQAMSNIAIPNFVETQVEQTSIEGLSVAEQIKTELDNIVKISDKAKELFDNAKLSLEDLKSSL